MGRKFLDGIPSSASSQVSTIASSPGSTQEWPSASLAAWLAIAVLTAALTAVSTAQALDRYERLESGWSWDLAYYNQWFWTLVHGGGRISVRPASAYATEGPSIWKMNYLAPVRLLIAPFYAAAPGPRTLIVIQNIIFWWVVPAAFGLSLAESRSTPAALSAALLLGFTPFFWPLVWNDFRELQLAIPFVIWAVQGVRQRRRMLTALGLAGMLACRQEFAVMAASFAFLPPAQPESLSRTLAWRHSLVLLGAFWLLFAFFGYMSLMVGHGAPEQFIDQFMGPKASLAETLRTTAETLILGTGCWALFALLAPRVFILALPWIWGLCSGRWANRFLATTEWHHVRYTVPATALVLAAGLIGHARLCSRLRQYRRGALLVALVTTIASLVSAFGLRDTTGKLASKPRLYDDQEISQIWAWIDQVGPHDGVIADYDVSAPLSSRTHLYSYILDSNYPPGFPHLDPAITWIFARTDSRFFRAARWDGFRVVHRGRLIIARRMQ